MDIEAAYKAEKYLVRSRLLKYTRQAFNMLPPLHKPRILDIGCGTGMPTLELAGLCDGEITGIDIDVEALEELRAEAERKGLTGRVKAIECSVTDMQFTDGSFDIIWSEGSIFTVGFEKGLREWKRLLYAGGFMVVHDEEGDVADKLRTAKECGYKVLGYIILDNDTWRRVYFMPLKRLVDKTLGEYGDSNRIPDLIEKDRREIEVYGGPGGSSSIIIAIQAID